jgi:uncharacterized phage infection (PIP) family protein YhgE
MKLEIHLVSPELATITNQLQEVLKQMGKLDDQIAALQADVTAESTAVDSAIALINGFSAQLAAAIAAAAAAGATPTQLQSLTDLDTAIKSKTTDLAAAVAAGTPPPAPAPAP